MNGRWAVLLIGAFAARASVARADEVAPPEAPEPTRPAALALGVSEPQWLAYAAFRNDVFTELIPPMDDRGFTHDNVLVLRRRHAPYTFGGAFVHRFITSRIDRRRWDLLELFALAEHSVSRPFAEGTPTTLVGSLRAGPVGGGNFGGRYLQNGWHEITETGPTVDEGLANEYPGDRRFGFVVGARARASVGERLQAYGFVDGQLALGGTGVTSVQTAVGASGAHTHVGAHVEVALTRYHVGDPYLALPGAYGRGVQFEWRAGVDVHWSRYRIGYEYRANEGGSGEPIGVVEFSLTR